MLGLYVLRCDSIWWPPHCSALYSCKIGTNNSVSNCSSGKGNGAACNHVVTYHFQNFAIGWVAKHGLGLNECNVCIVHHLDDVSGSILVDANSNFSFKILEINEGHTFVVVANNDIT